MSAVEEFDTEDSEFEDLAIERDERPGLLRFCEHGLSNEVLRR